MRNFEYVVLLGIVFIASLTKCTSTDSQAASVNKEYDGTALESKLQKTAVEILELQPTDFYRQILSQGKVQAKHSSRITFKLDDIIKEVFVEVGTKVEKGQLLALLENFRLKNRLQKIENQIAQAEIAFEAKLIGLGYTATDSIPESILKSVQLESNLPGLAIDKAAAIYDLEQSRIVAPISGIIAEVEAQAGNPSSNYETLCTIIDNDNLLVTFPVLESELRFMQKGQSLKISPMQQADQHYRGKVLQVTPQVDDQGSILVYAKVMNPNGLLIDGMSVKVVVERTIPDQIAVPKSAVLDRQDELIVFTCKDGKAHWNYVQIGLENREFYTITKGLALGDTIIIDNNFHLSHLEEVSIVAASN